MTPSILRSSLVLVGPGRAGRAFARSWIRAGGALKGIVATSPAASERAAAEFASEVRSTDTVWSLCDLLVLAVPDDRIAAAAADLAGRVSCRFAFHLSGALPGEILSPFRSRGAAVASLHPLRAFTGDSKETWEGAFVAIEGDSTAVEMAQRLTAALGSSGHGISPESKPLYHAAATLAAGGTVALLSIAVRAAVDAGLTEAEARPALARLAAEAAAATAGRSFAEAFTGPVARRDAETVRAHQAASAGRADFRELYHSLAREILDATSGRGKEEEIRAILGESEKPDTR